MIVTIKLPDELGILWLIAADQFLYSHIPRIKYAIKMLNCVLQLPIASLAVLKEVSGLKECKIFFFSKSSINIPHMHLENYLLIANPSESKCVLHSPYSGF